MEGLQGPMDPCQLHQGFEFLEEKAAHHELYSESGSFAGHPFTSLAFSDRMPFHQMLGVEPLTPPSPPPPPGSFIRRQHQLRSAVELESCITHASESHSSVNSETKELQYPLGVVVAGEAPVAVTWKGRSLGREKRKWKRKWARPEKNKEEVESQRMSHIAVERNRRKQMNNHLNALQSLMPPSFIQRGDQATIVGGAIDFVKELEQLLQSLEAEKRRRNSDDTAPFHDFFASPQYRAYSGSLRHTFLAADEAGGGELRAENRAAADVEVKVIQSHANLKVLSPRRPGQLLKAIAAMEELNLTILHVNVTSLDQSVLYSFNLKIEEDCNLASADKIAAAVYQIFSYINTD